VRDSDVERGVRFSLDGRVLTARELGEDGLPAELRLKLIRSGR
jgi:hypothetical protein